MIIKCNEIKSTTIKGIIDELYVNNDVMTIVRGNNLRRGDAIEAMASDLFHIGKDIDTDNYLHIS